MMVLQASIAFIAAVVGTIRLLSQIALWQRKEYRWDRLRSHLGSPQGRLQRYPWLLAAVAAVGTSWAAYLALAPAAAEVLGGIALGLFTVHQVWPVWRRGLDRPHLTQKTMLVLVSSVILAAVYGWLLFVPEQLLALQAATFIYFLPGLTALAIALANVIGWPLKRRIITRAQAKRLAKDGLIVIGITGSYGKTSTKHFLHHLLQAQGRCAATKNHRNAELPVAYDMLEQLSAPLQWYIAEMGAYRPGEITKLTALTKPRIGVVTAISNQHVDLFGSLEKLAAAKWELIRALPSDGVAVLNRDDETVYRLGQTRQRATVWYSITQPADVYADDITVEPETVRCRLHIGSRAEEVTIPIVSRGLLSNVVAAVAAAHAADVAADDIFAQLPTLPAFPHTMELAKGLNGAVIIDDSYSANEAGVRNALEHLARMPQPKKRVVLLPLLELGELGPQVHRRLGQQLSEVADEVVVYGNAYQTDLTAGAGAPDKFRFITDPHELLIQASRELDSQTAVLIENRVPAIVRDRLLASTK